MIACNKGGVSGPPSSAHATWIAGHRTSKCSALPSARARTGGSSPTPEVRAVFPQPAHRRIARRANVEPRAGEHPRAVGWATRRPRAIRQERILGTTQCQGARDRPPGTGCGGGTAASQRRI
eukprot:14654808-Alexandrium_andersonii.AAC.2